MSSTIEARRGSTGVGGGAERAASSLAVHTPSPLSTPQAGMRMRPQSQMASKYNTRLFSCNAPFSRKCVCPQEACKARLPTQTEDICTYWLRTCGRHASPGTTRTHKDRDENKQACCGEPQTLSRLLPPRAFNDSRFRGAHGKVASPLTMMVPLVGLWYIAFRPNALDSCGDCEMPLGAHGLPDHPSPASSWPCFGGSSCWVR